MTASPQRTGAHPAAASETVAAHRAAEKTAKEIEEQFSKLQVRRDAAEAQRDEARSTMKALLLAEAGADVTQAQSIIRQAEEEISAITDAISDLGEKLGTATVDRDWLATSVRLEAAAEVNLAQAAAVDEIAAALVEPMRVIAEVAARLEKAISDTPQLVTFEDAIDTPASHAQRVVGVILAEALANAYSPMFVRHPKERVREKGFVVERFFHLDEAHPSAALSLSTHPATPHPLTAEKAAAALISDPLRQRAAAIVAKREFDPKRERTAHFFIETARQAEPERWLPEGETAVNNTLVSPGGVTVQGESRGMTQRFLSR